MDTNAVWTSVPTNTSTHNFKWYGGTTLAMNLDGLGILTVNGTGDSTSSTTELFKFLVEPESRNRFT